MRCMPYISLDNFLAVLIVSRLELRMPHLNDRSLFIRIFKRFQTQDRDIPSRTWWTLLSSKGAEVRADVFYEEWRRRETEDRRLMERMGQNVKGFWTEGFVLQY